MSLVLVTKSATAPANPYDGQMWIDTTGVPTLKIYDKGGSDWLVSNAVSENDKTASVGLFAATGGSGDAAPLIATDVDSAAKIALVLNGMGMKLNIMADACRAAGGMQDI